MNLKKKKNLNLKIILLFIILTQNTNEVIQNILGLTSNRCNPGLVQSFEFTGSKYPGSETIEMCPTVRNTCCLKKDQLILYRSWIDQKQRDNIKKRFDYFSEIYSDLISSLKKVNKRAETTKNLLEKQPVSNCKVLSRRVLHYQIDELESHLNDAVEDMYDFLYKSYEGFYCSICDASTHQFIDDKNFVFQLSKGFCRNLLAHSLNPLLYFHVHFVKYLNLASKFMLSCDYKGDYTEESIPPQYLFQEDSNTGGLLTECKEFRNEKNWLKKCKKVCEKFHPSQITDFFKPNLERYFFYEQYITGIIENINIAEQNGKKKGKKQTKKTKKKSLIDFKPKMKYTDIFTTGQTAVFEPDDYLVKIDDKGIDFNQAGILSQIDDTIYKQVQVIFADKPDVVDKKVKAKKVKKIGVDNSGLGSLGNFCGFFMVFFIM